MRLHWPRLRPSAGALLAICFALGAIGACSERGRDRSGHRFGDRSRPPLGADGQGAGRPTARAAGAGGAGDSAFAALQQRGAIAMGVDQYTSSHRFDPLPDGGLITLERNADDSVGAAQIRQHLRQVARAFSEGDFGTPAFVHLREVPGARVMTAKRAAIAYEVRDLPRGGELRITTRDAEAVRAIHQFLAFQRTDHRVGAR